MAIIRKDNLGLYILYCDRVVRPIDVTTELSFKSSFKEGDKTESKHFGGSTVVGMGKLKGRGKYKEYWTLTQ
jgi:hypothetical protein